MADSKIKLHDAEARDGNVALRIPIDGRLRTFVLKPDDALAYANRIANVGVGLVGPLDGRLDLVDNIELRPTDDGGADLAIMSTAGPCLFHLPANWLVALSQAAADLLEQRDIAGRA